MKTRIRTWKIVCPECDYPFEKDVKYKEYDGTWLPEDLRVKCPECKHKWFL